MGNLGLFSFVFDLPTLSFAVLLVMVLASLSLVAHWYANRTIKGLGSIALGISAFSFGNCVIFAVNAADSSFVGFMGQTFILAGHMWIWLGVSDFWQIRQQRLVLSVTGLTLAGLAALLYQTADGVLYAERNITLSLFVAAISLGIARTLIQAPGGKLGFYRRIVRRTTVGVGLAAALYVLHAFFNLYNAGILAGVTEVRETTLAATMGLEALSFAMLLALVVIIMTAERLQAELKIQEMMDPLTRALNRRAFLEVMKAVLARARRLAEPVSLVMVDIDKFKKVNHSHGRFAGDRALAEFAALVMAGRRSQDVFCRFGGEEFVLMLPGTPEEGVELVAERIKEKIETTSLSPEGKPIKLTISMGLVTARGDDLDADGMLDVVDRRMHNAQKLHFETIETAS